MFSSIFSLSLFALTQHIELDTLQKTANDRNEKLEKRINAILDIFRKHVPYQPDLGSLSKTLRGKSWLDHSVVNKPYGNPFPGIVGYFPVDFGMSLTEHPLFYIQILALEKERNYYIYFSTEKPLGPAEFGEGLKGKFLREATEKIKIRDCAFCQLDKGSFKVLYHMADNKKPR
jgi:hypothetical protein